MDRYWLLTWTTYGTWLPGDRRGFVSNVRGTAGVGARHNTPGTNCDADVIPLRKYMKQRLQSSPVYLVPEQASLLLAQFQETAAHRSWMLLAVAIMSNHVHVVVGVSGDPDPATLLRDFKSYGSRALTQKGSSPPGGTWWTESGSRRKLPGQEAVLAAIRYVQEQHEPLLVWTMTTDTTAASGGRQPPVEETDTPTWG